MVVSFKYGIDHYVVSGPAGTILNLKDVIICGTVIRVIVLVFSNVVTDF